MIERWYLAALASAFAVAGGAILLGGGAPSATLAAAPLDRPPGALSPIRYDRDVRPILSDRCFLCHGVDPGKRQADLRLDLREVAVAQREGKGKPRAAIVPGEPGKSELWQRLTSHDAAESMPPRTSNKKPLSSDELAIVKRWIEEGAEYEPHWSFVAPKNTDPPAVKQDSWAKGPIDRYILSGLESSNLAPSPEADRVTLLRRLFLDLTGLPPTPGEVAAFEADSKGPQGPTAYERQVDRLLTEEPYRTRYAERMAVPWLDQARYADTSGIHMDAGRSIWPYRDWVLGAYRENMPFDRFVIEQLAGDLLPNATVAQKVASGFHRCHVTSDEGGAIDEEYRLEYAVDRVSTTGSVFLGLTVGCARCHDHKFDPVTADDFYSMIAFFNSIEEPGIYSQIPDNKRALEPFMAVPSPEIDARLTELRAELEKLKADRETPSPEEQAQRDTFIPKILKDTGVSWAASEVVSAESTKGAKLTVQPDASVLASGDNPKQDHHIITIKTEGTGLRLLSLDALADPSLGAGRVGRAPNGNAVLSRMRVHATSIKDPTQSRDITFGWAWADFEQTNGDFKVVNTITDTGEGWAVDGHNLEGGRTALFLANEPFGYEGGTQLKVTLEYDTRYDFHVFGRVRLGVGTIADAGLAFLPEGAGSWYTIGPFPGNDRATIFDQTFGPEIDKVIDLAKDYEAKEGPDKTVARKWAYNDGVKDGRAAALAGGLNVHYVAHRVYSPTARKLDLSLGSDDGLRVFVNGVEQYKNNIERGIIPDSDKATIELAAGLNTVMLKIVNTGGPAGVFHRDLPRAEVLSGPLAGALLPEPTLTAARRKDVDNAWRLRFSPRYAELTKSIAQTDTQIAQALAMVPVTMVMKEMPKPRDTFVMTRGQYDHPDKTRPVQRGVPRFLGSLSQDAPKDRLGLARWLVSEQNPLLARVTVNRLWEQFMGKGLVRTTEDFGMQGEWPSHPELLDFLAIDFRESGWDVRRFVRAIVTSSTYRQSSRLRPDALKIDPANRLISFYPRQRLSAEQLRDQALYVSGLLVEQLGGPSVKPYQPPGIWEEVAMPQSNTRVYERGKGNDLYRRSMYTYWKRASPPPSMLTLDSPTREYCTIRRLTTNTPLHALTLWNDEQFVEAARMLALRVLLHGSPLGSTDEVMVDELFQRCTGRTLTPATRATLLSTLATFRERYKAAPTDASKMLMVGDSPPPDYFDPAELASWTMLANAVLSADVAIVKD
ncbi:MAG: PSD1 and planctomycete cytochrome C domain-containing protein [Planctomycetota bacterium]